MIKPKYRIIKRPSAGIYCYFAQKKTLFMWIDLPMHSLCEYDGRPSCETPSHSLKLVEDYVDYVILKKHQRDIVVKEYYE